MTGLAVGRVTLQEVVSRRLVLWGAVLSLAFLALFAAGFTLLYARAETVADPEGLFVVFAATLQTVLGLYIVSFLASFLGLLLSAGSVAAEIDSGTLQAVLARPLRRSAWLLQRWGACAALLIVYAAVMGGVLLLVARLVAGYAPVDALRTLALLSAQAVLVLTLGMLGSTRLSTLATGVVVFCLYGLAWLAGIIEFIGDAVANRAMVNLGIAVSLLMPSDALWRGASYYASSPTFVAEAVTRGGLPFSSTAPPAPALLWWSVGWVTLALLLALRTFARRDI